MPEYDFTSDWFSDRAETWRSVLPHRFFSCERIIEVGCYEGRSTVWIMEHMLRPDGGEIVCIDNWIGGIEHNRSEMVQIEERFNYNMKVALSKRPNCRLTKIKERSFSALLRLISAGEGGTFDLIYIDGSHQAPDVLRDLVCAFSLCKTGGAIVTDDYLWGFGRNPLYCPKLALDAFTTCFARNITLLNAPLKQLIVLKVADT
jgi:hypothetical protein